MLIRIFVIHGEILKVIRYELGRVNDIFIVYKETLIWVKMTASVVLQGGPEVPIH